MGKLLVLEAFATLFFIVGIVFLVFRTQEKDKALASDLLALLAFGISLGVLTYTKESRPELYYGVLDGKNPVEACRYVVVLGTKRRCDEYTREELGSMTAVPIE